MIFVLSVMALFIVMAIYFFFRAEKLQRELILVKRENASTRKEMKTLLDSLALLASRHETFVKTRLKALKNDDEQESNFEIITPLINNYSSIFLECLKGKGRLKAIVQKCYSGGEANAFKDFTQFLVKQDIEIRRQWSSNNLNGFISLVESLLVNLKKEELALQGRKQERKIA